MIDLTTYCRKGSTLYYSLLYKPAAQRQAIIAIDAFYQETFKIITDFSDVALARVKLQWWHEQVEKIYGINQDHLIANALAEINKLYPIEKHLLHAIINGFETYLDNPLFETQQELTNFFGKTAAIREQLIENIIGDNKNSKKYLTSLTNGFEIVFHIMNLTFYRKKGHFFFAQQELDQAHCSIDEIAKDKTTSAVKNFLHNQVNFANDNLKNALVEIKQSDILLHSHNIIKISIYTNLLYEIEKSDFTIIENPIDLTPLRKFWIAWRTYRNLKKSSIVTSHLIQ